MKLLISGTASGLGKHLHTVLGGDAWKRSQSCAGKRVDVIIHCAWPARPPETNDSLASYVENTVELTRRLLEQPHDKFIFVSTAEVYPLQGHTGEEDQPIATERVRDLYAHTKLMAEALVRERGRNALILRCTGLLGPTARPSSLIRILRENRHTLTLSLESRFCHVLHEDVTAFILAAIERNLPGIYNLCSSESVTLGEVARSFGRNVSWGTFAYNVGVVDNRKTAAICSEFDRTSSDVNRQFGMDHFQRSI